MKKAGILGGGQLGRMLLQAAANYPVETFVMENDPACPAAHLCQHFVLGDITSFEDVYAFGKELDVLTIEIEHVNTEALEKLESEGVEIIPSPSVLRTIKNKILQKEFYNKNEILTSPFAITTTRNELALHPELFPAVHKLAEGGYDGKGVRLLPDKGSINQGFDAPAVLEKAIDIKKEISAIIAINKKGETAFYPIVDMIFDPTLNLVSFQFMPAELPDKVKWRAEALALKTVKSLNSPGIFAIECFVDKNDQVYVNETAPRVHNSGHQTIEACYSSQFDMLWRILLDYPLGNPQLIMPAAMINIIGENDKSGPAAYEGLEEVLKMDNVFLHLYGKKMTHPGRKMGHVTVISQERQELTRKCNQIRNLLKATAIK